MNKDLRPLPAVCATDAAQVNKAPGEPLLDSRVVLRAIGVHKSYFGAAEVPVLRGVDLEVRQGEFVSIIGSSGCGKSTLLHVLGTLDTPTRGAVFWRSQRMDNQSSAVRDRFRNEVVGFIFQFYHLLPELTALENVMLPALIRHSVLQYFGAKAKLRRHASELLARVGLGHRLQHKPRELSGGEMQRAAIARALLVRPQVLLADEPTGNLDAETGRSILELICELRREIDLTILMVTHDHAIAERADRVLRLTTGQLEEQMIVM